ncbi:MAG: family 78 glycoside hydrolase catalytic domain [Acidobacteria bacterium]|nr:family 78 glycoside hydrolase catalytic domain [Acidobacteriota bacterium]
MTSKINRREFLIASGAAAGLTAVAPSPLRAKTARVRVVGPKVDYIDRPLGLENLRPCFSWRLESDARNVRQSAYRVLVASSESLLQRGQGDLWDSGKISSRKSFGIAYKGQALQSRQRCWWRVQVWDQAGQPSDPSVVSQWEMGLLSPGDWTAQWLAVDDAVSKADRETPMRWIWGSTTDDKALHKIRYHFRLPAPTKGGVLFTYGRSYENVTGIWVDGIPLGTEIPVQNLAREHIALPRLSAGEHCLAIEVGLKNPAAEVFVSQPPPAFGVAVFARFDVESGQRIRLTSGPEWKTSLTQEPDWYQRQYDDKAWSAVASSSVESMLIPDPAMYLRREFTVGGTVVTARLYATALGCYEARLNGNRIGDALLAPEVSQYGKRALYRVYDVTDMLQTGRNVLGLTVGDGWYASHPRYGWGLPPRRVIAQLELTLADGSRQAVVTSPDWHISRSPILQSELCVGELYDARLEQSKWDTVGFDDSDWQKAETATRPSCSLVAQVSPPIRATQILKPQAITNPVPGAYVFDFGQNFAGWCRLRVKGAAGTRIDLHFAEELKPSGEIDQFVLLGGKASDTYILRGDPAGETFEPHFTYHGFRYVQVTGLPVTPSKDALDGIVINSDLGVTGHLRIDNSLIERIWRNTVWSQRSNFVGIPTDCPNRAERMGYGGDAGVLWDAAAFNMDVAAFTRRQMDNVRDAQYSSGAFPVVAPIPTALELGQEPKGTAPAWGDGGVILPWTSWRQYGDLEVIEQNWEAMNRYLQFIRENNRDYIWRNKRGDDYGDWQAIGNNHFYHPDKPPTTPLDLIGTAYWAYSANMLAEMAEAIGRPEDSSRLHTLYERVRQAFNDAFVKPDGRIGNESQTSYVLALKFGLVSDHLRAAAAERLVSDIRQRGIALSTGIMGTRFILDVLAEAGYNEIIYNLLLRTEHPSWGFMIANGATTMWEMWDGDLQHLHNEGSHNHYALGSICGFLFRRLAGIDAATPGFETIVVRPVLDPRVKKGGGDYDSVMGRVSTDWTQGSDGSFTLEATIPANTTAHIHLPARRDSRIEEGGKEISHRNDMRIVDRLDHEAVIELGSGSYRFIVRG